MFFFLHMFSSLGHCLSNSGLGWLLLFLVHSLFLLSSPVRDPKQGHWNSMARLPGRRDTSEGTHIHIFFIFFLLLWLFCPGQSMVFVRDTTR